VGGSDGSTYPLQKKRHSLEYLRTIAHLRPRTNTIGAVSRVRSALAQASHRFFQSHGFVWVASPIITASDCEGAGDQFRVTTLVGSVRCCGVPWCVVRCGVVQSGHRHSFMIFTPSVPVLVSLSPSHPIPFHYDSLLSQLPGTPDASTPVKAIPTNKDGSVDWSQDFFKRPAYLTVSGQLNAEIYACALHDVYTFGPTFRAENSNTSRHLAEFWVCRLSGWTLTSACMHAHPLSSCSSFQTTSNPLPQFLLVYTYTSLLPSNISPSVPSLPPVPHPTRHPPHSQMIEPELAFADLADDMACATAYLKYIVSTACIHAPWLEGGYAYYSCYPCSALSSHSTSSPFPLSSLLHLHYLLSSPLHSSLLLSSPFSPISQLQEAMSECAEDFRFFDKFVEPGIIQRLTSVVESEFEHVPYTDAIQILKKAKTNFDYPVEWGIDLQSEHERYLTEKAFKNRPIIVTDYPKDIKAFYMRLNDDGKTVAAMDVLVPRVGELIGGSQREERLEVLEGRMRDVGLDPQAYWWYLDLRRYGSVPHAGFGLGFERLVQFATGVENIRDAIPFPRVPGSADF
ncbi:unnamed protein product, partial [Closterium sp. NIES-54]